MLRRFRPLFLFGGLLFLAGGALVVLRVMNGVLNWSFLSDEAEPSKEENGVEEVVGWRKGPMLSMKEKLNEIEVGPFDLRDSTLEESIEFLRMRARANDPGPPERSGVSFIVRARRVVDADEKSGELGGGSGLEKLITLKVGEVGLCDALDLVCEAAGCRWDIDSEYLKIVIQPKSMEYSPSEPILADPEGPFLDPGDEAVEGDDPFAK